jgi:hypothetical protein
MQQNHAVCDFLQGLISYFFHTIIQFKAAEYMPNVQREIFTAYSYEPESTIYM